MFIVIVSYYNRDNGELGQDIIGLYTTLSDEKINHDIGEFIYDNFINVYGDDDDIDYHYLDKYDINVDSYKLPTETNIKSIYLKNIKIPKTKKIIEMFRIYDDDSSNESSDDNNDN